jgi:hypothetical protein
MKTPAAIGNDVPLAGVRLGILPANPLDPPPAFADHDVPVSAQRALDEVEEASMESFPCSDPPSYTASHA